MLKWTPCACGAHGLVRIERTLWMRLVPARRHYYCPHCKTRQFLSRRGLRTALASPPRPLEPALPREMEPITRRMDESSLDPQATLPARYR